MNARARVARLSVLGVAWPLFVEQFLRTLIFNVDQWMLTGVSAAAAAAVGTGAFQVVVFSIIIFNFVAIGASVVITHHLGAGDREGAARISATAMGVNTWIGVAVSALVASLAPYIVRLQGVPAPMAAYALTYLTILGSTLFLDAQNLAMMAVLRAHGRTRDSMVVSGAVNVISVLGNATVLFGIIGSTHLAEHGVRAVAGVAISGIVARVVGFVVLRLLVARRTGIRLELRDYLAFPTRDVSRILRIGLPAAGENASYWLALMAVTGFVARLGPTAFLAYNFTRSVVMLVVVSFAMALGLGTEIVVGHLVGAGAFDEAFHRLLRSLRTGLLVVGLTTFALFLARHQVFRIYTGDGDVLRLCATLLLVELVIEPGRIFNIVVINSLRATGDALYPVLMGACSMWLLWVPLSWYLAFHTHLGLVGVWLAMACDEWLRAGMMYWRWRRRGWLENARRSHEDITALASAEMAENA